jgi:hypothetical protein
MVKKEQGPNLEQLRELMDKVKSQLIEVKNIRDEYQENITGGDLLGGASIGILKYISDNQDKSEEGITKEEITRYMDENELASRPTTLKTIGSLLKSNIIVNAKRRQNARNRLTINPEYGFKEFEADTLTGGIKDIHKKFKTLTDANNELVNDLLNMISKSK